MLVRNNLNDIMKPGKPLPSKNLMVKKALEILDLSPHGQQLSNFAEKKQIKIDVIETVEPTSYIPEEGKIYIGFNKNRPLSPSSFILMLAGALREAQQEAAGIKNPSFDIERDRHIGIILEKQEDKIWYICTIALELDSQEMFSEYKFLDELRKMGYSESLELVQKQK